jgi:hypothetical protein
VVRLAYRGKQETLEARKHKRDYGLELGKKLVGLFKKDHRRGRREGDTADETTSLLPDAHAPRSNAVEDGEFHPISSKRPFTKPAQPRPSFREAFSRQSVINLAVYSMLAMHSVASDQLLPIFMHHPHQSHTPGDPEYRLPFKFTGGFGLHSERIGFLFTLYGFCGMLIQFLIFPPVARRFGVLNCLKVCASAFPVIYFLTPFTALVGKGTTQQATMFALMFLKCVCVIFAFPCTTILLTNSAASLRVLGTLNGIATSLAAIGRAVGPAIGGSTFTLGVELGYVILPWWTISVLSICGAVPVWMLIEMDGFGDSDSGSGSDSGTDAEQHEISRGVLPDQNEQRQQIRAYLLGPDKTATPVRVDDEEEDEFAIDDTRAPSLVAGRERSESRARRVSAPIGSGGILPVGPGRERRMSSGLAQCNNGSLI